MTMNAGQRTGALIGRGYFPKELPPPFQTQQFADKLDQIRTAWSLLVGGLPANQRRNHPEPSRPILFDMARKGHSRRTLSITNPINQFYLAEEISKHWVQISSVIDRSQISLTKCSFASEGRAISMPPIGELAEKRIKLYSTKGAILQTDILSFYDSIYTHSIPWALHGKAVAKQNRNTRDPAVFGNRIDQLVRSGRDGQTVGVPVGPDTSRVISELLLAAIEQRFGGDLQRQLLGGYRYIDDFFLCFDSLGETEAALAEIREACLHFDLQLNASKTRTIPALTFLEETWPNEIAALKISSRPGSSQRRSLMRFFANVIAYSTEHPDESIANFAIRKTSKIMVSADNWDIYSAFLMRLCRENGNCVDSVVKVFSTYAAIGYSIGPEFSKFIERMIEDHAPYNHHFEVAWMLWLARSLSIRLSPTASSLVLSIENDVCALLALDLRGRRLLSGGSKLSSWIGTTSTEDLRGNHWLLVYESAQRRSWPVRGAAAAVAGDAFFAAMLAEGVSFFDSRAENRPLKLPGIDYKLNQALAGRKRAKLPGAIMAYRMRLFEQRDFEELGGDYGEEDDGFMGWDRDEDDFPDDPADPPL